MGRSVSYPSSATVITFASIDYSCDECGPGTNTDTSECEYCEDGYVVDEDGHRFEELVDDFRYQLQQMFPTVEEVSRWIDREDHVLAENGLAEFGMSVYCGLVSYWIVPKEDPYDGRLDGIAKRWISQISDKFVKAFGELTKVGAMSNGEGVYRRIDK